MWAIVPTAASDSAGASTAHLGARSAVARLSRGAPGLKNEFGLREFGTKEPVRPSFLRNGTLGALEIDLTELALTFDQSAGYHHPIRHHFVAAGPRRGLWQSWQPCHGP